MKKSLITEITIWILVCLLLSVGIIYGVQEGFGLEIFSREKRETGNSSMQYSAEYTQTVDSIDSLKISWLAGDVEIKKGSGKKIKITEYSSYEFSGDNELSLNVSSTVLNVSWNDTRLVYLDTVIPQLYEKNLVIEVPEKMSIDSITVNGVQSAVKLESLTAETISIDSSSDINIEGCKAAEIDLNTREGNISGAGTTSEKLSVTAENGYVNFDNAVGAEASIKNTTGDVVFTGEFTNLTIDSLKGSVTAATTVSPNNVDINTAEGVILLTTPDDTAADVTYSTLFGSFATDFAEINAKSGTFSIGTGESGSIKNVITLKTTNGKITFSKG